jgi:hypothetical protein
VLDATVNTDFAQVEIDDQQVNLDRFNLFFPEKRPFFLENAGFFTVGNPGEVDLFFSRAIGIGPDGEQMPIRGGARLSGKAGKFNVGLLNMQTGEVAGPAGGLASGQAGEVTGIPSHSFSVLRVSRDLPNRSSIGGLFVNRSGLGRFAAPDDHNRTYAIDGKLGIEQHTVVSSFAARTESPGISNDDHAYNLRSRTSVPRFDLSFGYQEVGAGFNPEVGFLSRRGYRKPDAALMTRFRPQNLLRLQEIRPHTSFRAFYGFDGLLESLFWHIDSHWEFQNSAEIHTGFNVTEEGVRDAFEIYPGVVVPPGSYSHGEAQLVFNTNEGAPINLNTTLRFGGFFGGRRVGLTPTLQMRAGETFTTELSLQRNAIDLPGGAFTTNLVRARISYAFNTRTFVQSLLQYNDRADLWSMNVRFGWLQAANTGLFIVYTDTRGLYDLFPGPARADRSFVVKFSRMFDVLD